MPTSELTPPRAPPPLRANRFAMGSAWTLGIRLGGMALSLATGLVLPALLGASSYGAYAIAVNLLGFLTTGASLGLDTVLVRFLSAYRETGRLDEERALLAFVRRTVTTTTLGLAALATLLAWSLPGVEPGLRRALLIILPLVPLTTTSLLLGAGLRGYQRVVRAQIPEALVQPGLLLALVGVAWLAWATPTVTQIAVLHAVTLLVVCLSAIVIARTARTGSALPASGAVNQDSITKERGLWLAMALPVVATTALQLAFNRGDVVLLGILTTSAEAGVYGVATRLGELVLLILDATTMVAAPLFAAAWARDGRSGLEAVVRRVAQYNFWLTLPIASGLFAFAPTALSIFGAEYVAGATALRILCVAQLASAAFGSVGQVLYMTGFPREVTFSVAVSAILHMVLAIALIPSYGSTGAAIATAIALVLFKLLLTMRVRKRLGIMPLALWPVNRRAGDTDVSRKEP